MVFDPMHFLPLLEQKGRCTGSGGAAKRLGPGRGILPPCTGFWKLAWARPAKREYVQVLRLMEDFEMAGRAWRRQAGTETWAPLVTMRSSIYCSAAFKSDRQGWTWIFIPTYPGASVETTKASGLHEPPGGGGSPMSEAPETPPASSSEKSCACRPSSPIMKNWRNNAPLKTRTMCSICFVCRSWN